MAVRHGQDAVVGVAELMDRASGRVTDLLDEGLPTGLSAPDPTPGGEASRWLWSPPGLPEGRGVVGGWARPETYRLDEDPAREQRLLRTPPAGLDDLTADEQHDYVRRSVDLAMRGGTTSGVVYPLAVCEIARGFRVRNVGGSSAGAIAAAATAAAELGRSSGREGEAPAPGTGTPGPQGRLRAGFSGLADMVAWVLQLQDGPGTGPEQYRLAQLFRPARAQRGVFALVVAVMRRRWWALPLAAGGAVGPLVGLAVALLAVVASLALSASFGCGASAGPATACAALGPATAPVALAGFLLALSGLLGGVLTLLSWWRARRPRRPVQPTPALRRLAEEAGSAPTGTGRGRGPAVGTLLVVAGLAPAGWGARTLGGVQLVQVVTVGLALVLLVVLLLVAAAAVWVGRGRRRHYGLLPGAAPPARPSPVARLAGVPAPSVDRALVPWLSEGLADLAGLPGQVLRFGHLWSGPGFVPLAESDDGSSTPQEAGVRALAADPAARLVNLEMMTTDLTRRRPYRFPLAVAGPVLAGPRLAGDAGDDGDAGDTGGGRDPADAVDEQLWFDPGDLCRELAGDGAEGVDVLPREVVEAMTALTPSRTVARADGDGTVTLHRLPHPWNLPVVLGVRISLALPLLFTAVRLYRLVAVEQVRDDLGRGLQAGSAPVPSQAHPCVAEPLWFSDGGLTSNFPVHLFDSPLPRWPSFGLTLGRHPPGRPTQDVRLPQDWDLAVEPSPVLGPGLTHLLGAALGSALDWRDTLQSALPGFRSRVAEVRQHPGEGGVSLFMTRQVVAALALRGALAGARLRERFRDDAQWERHRWVRLRVTATSLERLRGRVVRSRPLYEPLLRERELGLQRLADRLPGDPGLPPPAAWFVPPPGWWEHERAVLDGLAVPPPDPDVVAGGPRPEAVLRQSPTT